MHNRHIENTFIYVLTISLLLHLGVLTALYYFPPTPPVPPKEPLFIDLKIPPVPKKVPVKKSPRQVIKDLSKLQKAKPKEILVKPKNLNIDKHYYMPPKGPQTLPETGKVKEDSVPGKAERQPPQVESGSSTSSLLKPKTNREKLRISDDFSIKKYMSKKIEDQTRNQFISKNKSKGFGMGNGVDLSLESFSRRFFDGATNHLVHPPQAKKLGLEGVGTGEVTFNRKGEIIDINFTNSSGKEFDEAVINALKSTVTGPLPKAYKEDTATLPFVYIFLLPQQERR